MLVLGAIKAFQTRFGEKASVKDVVNTLRELGRDNWEAWLLCQKYELTISMLECGANIHADNDRAICQAAMNGYLKVVQLLLDRGADIHACDR